MQNIILEIIDDTTTPSLTIRLVRFPSQEDGTTAATDLRRAIAASENFMVDTPSRSKSFPSNNKRQLLICSQSSAIFAFLTLKSLQTDAFLQIYSSKPISSTYPGRSQSNIHQGVRNVVYLVYHP